MAQIKVEQKRGGLGWLWIVLALVVIAVLAWYFLSRPDAAAPTTNGMLTPAARALASVAGDAHDHLAAPLAA
ncbi:MAG: hypothetical protein WKG32_13470 [Gemmatimonadaceae bacterium]